MEHKNERKQKSQWLGRYQAALRQQELLEQELAELRAQAEHMSQLLNGMPGAATPTSDRLPRVMERISAAREALESEARHSAAKSNAAAFAEIAFGGDSFQALACRELLRL